MDTFVFENASAFNDVDIITDYYTGSGDKLDISDILDGHYDEMTDLITDFVQITTNGSDSELRIDTTGSATFGGGTMVALLQNVTGLTDEADLLSNGYLIAA